MPSALAKKIMKKREVRKDFRVLQSVDPTKQVEMFYRNELLKGLWKLFAASNIERLPEGFTRDVAKEEAYKNYMQRLTEAIKDFNRRAERLASRVAKKSDETHRKRFIGQMKRELGVDVGALLSEEKLTRIINKKIKENVEYIRNVSDDYKKKVASAVRRSMVQGNRESLTEEIQKIKRISEGRARNIARDQTAKFNTALSRERQEQLGMDSYVWSSSKDERVRPTHRANDGKVFRWDSPPPDTGHPGDDPLCRCTARPILNIRGTETSATAVSQKIRSIEGTW